MSAFRAARRPLTRTTVLALEELEPRVLMANDFLQASAVLNQAVTVPGALGQTIQAKFSTAGKAKFKDEVGFFRVDDLRGGVDGLLPGDPGYAAAALARRHTLFNAGQKPGVTSATLPSTSLLGFYRIKDGSAARLLRQNRFNRRGKGPVVFFNFATANPGGTADVVPAGDGIR